jgi:branched-chain amino acid transport system substrate-binding protein
MLPEARSVRSSAQSRRSAVIAVVAVALSLLLAACSSSQGSSSEASGSGGGSTKTFTVGFIGTLSGPLEALGSAWLAGLQASLAYQAKHGAPYTISVNAQDDRDDPSTAVTAARSIYAGDPLAIVGIPASDIGAAIAPLALANKVPVIGTGILPPENAYSYAAGLDITQTFADEVPLFKYLARQSGRPQTRLALLASDTASGHKSVAPVQSLIKGSSVSLVSTQYIDVTGTSFDAQAAEVVASKANIVGVTNTATSMVSIVHSLRSAGFTGAIVNYWAGASDVMLKQLNDPNVYVYRDFADPSEPAAATMVQDAKSVGGAAPQSFVNGNYYTQGWVIGELLMNVLKACGSSCNAQSFNTALQTKASSINTAGLTGANGFTTTNHTFLHEVHYWTWDKAKQVQTAVTGLPTATAY